VQELMAVSDIAISEGADVEVRIDSRVEGTVDLTALEKRENGPIELTLVENTAVTADGSDDPAGSDDLEDDLEDDGAPPRPGSLIEIGTLVEGGSEVLPPELAWQERALCAQTDPEAFFPEKGGSTREAKRVCMSCEVRAECLDYALAKDERFGIWGGLSERERRRVKKQAV
jgi:WhiB family transcriptional regulator, redox-sensing transcriptional regulator